MYIHMHACMHLRMQLHIPCTIHNNYNISKHAFTTAPRYIDVFWQTYYVGMGSRVHQLKTCRFQHSSVRI